MLETLLDVDELLEAVLAESAAHTVT